MDAGAEKDEAMQLALAAAIDVPREMAKLTLACMDDLREFVDKCNPYLISDLTAAAALGAAVVRLCDYNVAVNTPQLDDKQAGSDVRAGSLADLKRAENTLRDIERTAGRN